MNSLIYERSGYRFVLEVTTEEEHGEKATSARILREKGGKRITLMAYTWPKQLIPEIFLMAPGTLNEKGWLTFTLALSVHHISGMVQGEFTEEQDYVILDPLAESLVCSVEDIRRKTKFALTERHLEHTPHRTYPPTDGMQGPYGHPTVKSLPPIAKKSHPEA